jgi:uncharacterized protein YecE (DUF72 family)
LTEYLIGTGGWGYFKVGNKLSLKSYSEIFNFVEVNYTFYEYPRIQMVETWRRSVKSNFTFSVRCHQDLTHRIGLRPVNRAYETFYKMKTYCDTLNSPYLVLETPSKYTVNQENVGDAREFFSALNLKGIRLVWEYRAPANQAVVNLMQDFNIIQCVDLSREKPAFNSDVTYSRLFGKGQRNIYQFTDEELVEIDHKAEETKSKIVAMSYHGLRMNTDALRFLQYKKAGNFIPVTSFVGVDSARAVLAEDAKFPSSKQELTAKQGWKVIDLASDKRAHLSEFLSRIPDKTYSNIDEVMNELRAVL